VACIALDIATHGSLCCPPCCNMHTSIIAELYIRRSDSSKLSVIGIRGSV
jgi:hypothetical protein